MVNFDKPTETEQTQPKAEAVEPAPSGPKRVIHRSTHVTGSGETNRRPVSLFRFGSWRRKKSPDGEKVPLQEASAGVNPETESIPPAGEPESQVIESEIPSPGQRLRELENAGKIPPVSQDVEANPGSPASSNPPRPARPAPRTQLLPNGERTRRAYWDVGSGLSLVVNIILLVVVFLLAIQVNTLKNTVNSLLGGMFNNFVRMDNSVISSTINMTDVPIPINFSLPINQPETNVTLTREVTVQGARVTINSGALTIDNAPATVTLPAGTTLPVSLQMDVPVQTTVLVNLQVPVNIKLAEASSADVNIGNLHTAFTGLQDTIGPLFCQFNPAAQDYLNSALCNAQGEYIPRSPTTRP